LVTFFAAFTFTLNEFNARTASFNADRDTLVIANALKGDSYIATHEEFQQACNGLRVRGLNYASGIVESSEWKDIADKAKEDELPYLAEMVDHFYAFTEIENEIEVEKSLQCAIGLPSMEADPPDPLIHKDELSTVLSNRPFVVLAFPLALETEYAVVPATLVVITWRV
jgi:hypothetical protein